MSNLDPSPVDLEDLFGMLAGKVVIEAYGTVTPPPDQPTPDQKD